MTFEQLLIILRARWVVLALVFLSTIGLTLIASLLLPKSYYAQTQVVIDLKPDPIEETTASSTRLSPTYMATQIDIIRSERMGLLVVERLKLANNPDAIQTWREATNGRGSIQQHFAKLLLKNLEVKPSRSSTVLTIGYTGRDPDFAATIANSFAQAYVQTNIDMKVEPAKLQRDWFTNQRAELRTQLDSAQATLSRYQRDNNIVSADESLDVESRRLQELSTTLTILTSDSVANETSGTQARRALANGKGATLPEVLNNWLIIDLKASLARQQTRYQEQLAVLGERHPEILKLQEEIRSIRRRISGETRTIVASLASQTSVSNERVEEARAALARQQEKVLGLKIAREELTVLQRDVDNAQRAYDDVVQRLNQTTLESQSNRANLFVLSTAQPASSHVSPRLSDTMPLAAFFGVIFALCAAIGLELLSRRVRTDSDIESIVGAPVMGAIGRLSKHALKDQEENTRAHYGDKFAGAPRQNLAGQS